MNDRYDTAGNIETQFQPASNGRLLANKLGISDPVEMNEVELDLLNRLYEETFNSVAADQAITVADITEWHRRWLINVYDWAGRYRTLNMAKGDFQFAATAQIERLMGHLDEKILPVHTPCQGRSEERLIEAIAVVHVELILIHPFREGNGRLSRLLANVMAGWRELDFTSWDEHREEYFACIQTGMSDYEPLKGLVSLALREAGKCAVA
ncbi:MAG: Fic family protein [Gammaproteobacteria bacterium]|nr:Fic family protein [Gammaproteobacteria bacterium]MYF51341.1 Fic family protein [Gammaproteobacteria bacterium]MYH16861.1 Fic family protein [Gammaproteobacteria bacterium]MYK83288.1 Fic family protein [Gammaproteobacteria bacterium]